MPTIAIVHGVAGDDQRAAVGSQYVLRRVGLGQSGHGVGSGQSDHGRGGRRRSGGIVDLGVGCRRDGQCRWSDRPRRRTGRYDIVVAAVAVVDRVACDVQRAAVRSQHVLRRVGLFHSCGSICPQQATHCWCGRGGRRCVVDLGVRDRGDRQGRWGDCPLGGDCGDGVVISAVAIVNGVTAHVQRAAVCSEHIL